MSLLCFVDVAAGGDQTQKGSGSPALISNLPTLIVVQNTQDPRGVLLRVDQTPEDKVKLAGLGLAWLITNKSTPSVVITTK